MTCTDPRPTLDDDQQADDPRPEGATVTETVVTTATGMAVGMAALWFLAPICFVC